MTIYEASKDSNKERKYMKPVKTPIRNEIYEASKDLNKERKYMSPVEDPNKERKYMNSEIPKLKTTKADRADLNRIFGVAKKAGRRPTQREVWPNSAYHIHHWSAICLSE
jgi:hypothetical protein